MSRVITERVEITDEMLKPSKRLIDVNALMEDINESLSEMTSIGIAVDGDWLWAKLNDAIAHAPTIEERKKGKWIEKHHAYFDEEKAIEEWQSCKCSECGRYDTRPYMYYFNEPHFCSWCGADMRERREE